MYTYTIGNGAVLTSDEPLDVDQIEKAKADHASGRHISEIAEEHGAGVYSPPSTTAHLFGLNG